MEKRQEIISETLLRLLKIFLNWDLSFALGLGASTSTAKTNIHLVDVNGDGLPDLVYKNGSNYYYYP